MDLSALWDVVANVGILAKDIGKGGGGSTEEPTVCISLLPVAAGVAFVAVRALRERLRTNAQAGVPAGDWVYFRPPGGRTAAVD